VPGSPRLAYGNGVSIRSRTGRVKARRDISDYAPCHTNPTPTLPPVSTASKAGRTRPAPWNNCEPRGQGRARGLAGQIALNGLTRRPPNATVPEVASFGTVSEGEMRQIAGLERTPDTAPNTESGTVIALPRRKRTEQEPDPPRREYLTEKEVSQLCDAARARGRWGHRDATMILVAYRHGLRVSELVALRWEQVDLDAGAIAGAPAQGIGRQHSAARRERDPRAATHPAGAAGRRALRVYERARRAVERQRVL
jgi:hypothetical protein